MKFEISNGIQRVNCSSRGGSVEFFMILVCVENQPRSGRHQTALGYEKQ